MKPVSAFGSELSLKFIVVEAHLPKIETRASIDKLRAPIPVSSPLNGISFDLKRNACLPVGRALVFLTGQIEIGFTH